MLRLRVVTSTVMGAVAVAGMATAQTPEPASVPGAAPSSLRAFAIPKPPEETLQEAPELKLQDTLRERTRLPAQHDLLRTTVGLGHVLQRDWGVELNSSGRLRGLQANLNSFVTVGAAGVETPSARLSLFEPRSGWGVEVGDVLSELRGLARGARIGLSGNRRHRPSLSMYVPSERLHDTATIFGLRDEIRLFSHVVAGGEITSDKSYFARAAYVGRRIDVQASYRRILTDDPAADAGVMASYTVRAGVSLNAGFRTFQTASDKGASRLLSLKLPIANIASFTLEDTRSTSHNSDDVSNAVGFQLLRGPLQLTQRFQWGESEYLRIGDPFGIEQRQLQTSASFSPRPWASFSPQTVTQWLPDGRAQQWQELQSEFRLSRTGRLQLYTSLPHLLDQTRFRSRFTQELKNQLTLVVDYGRVSAFQGGTVATARDVREPRLSVMIRKTWQTPTPAYGGEVSGRVLDQRGTAVVGAGVQLGQYLVFTDEAGRYVFPRVPYGDFELKIAPEYLSARYASDGRSQRISMRGAARHVADLTVVPLDSIRGRVYLDANRNGRFDAGEGRRGVVMRLSNLVTATDSDGAYGFYNLPPGAHVVRVDAERLRDTEAVKAGEARVLLEAGKAATGVDFVLLEKQKPVLLQKLAAPR